MALAGAVDFGGSNTQFAAFVYADDDAVDGAARGFARSGEVFHKFPVCLVIVLVIVSGAVTDKTKALV
jgi:hypothetical protein